jgi:DNA-binding transcriptional MerR regulator
MHAIGEAARRSGVAIETIRYYERAGIVSAPGRSARGRRLYTDAEIARLRFVRRCRDLGFSTADTRSLLALSTAGGSCQEVREFGRRQLAAVACRIGELQRLRTALKELVARCSDGEGPWPGDCPMLAALIAD